MKVGVLIADGTAVDDLIKGLESAGVHVQVHMAGATGLSSALACAFLEKASAWDLIHNLAGGRGLLLAHLSDKPLVTSLQESPAPEDLTLFRAASSSCYFISEHGLAEALGLKPIPGVGSFQGDRVGFYLNAYALLLAVGRKRENRPWGSFEVLSDDHGDHKVKRIVVLPGRRLSLQYHGRRREHWIIVSGSALVTVGENEVRLESAQAIDIPRGEPHRVENVGGQDLVFIEVQQGDYFGEDDIVRLEDDFGRL